MAARKSPTDGPVVIKKYANRRLYNTASSTYVTLEHLSEMIREGVDFQVFDAKSGEDITRSVLTQIIVEQEAKGENLLPIDFLKQIIGFYGDSLGGLLPSYLDQAMSSFVRHEEQMRSAMQGALGFPSKQFEQMGQQNMALMQNAMRMMNPFMQGNGDAAAEGEAGEKQSPDDIDELKKQLNAMQEQLNRMSKDG